MNHYVVASDGQKYGPANVATLNEWIGHGRLFPTNTLEEEGTGRRFPAGELAGLNFAVAPTASAPYPRAGTTAYAPYQPAPAQNEHGKVLGAFALAIGAVIVALFIGIFSLFLAIWGIQMAWASKEDGHPAGWFAVAFNVLAIIAVIVIKIGGRTMLRN